MGEKFQSMAEHMHWISSVPLGITIATIGLIGNSLSVLIWYRILKKRIDAHPSTSIFLIALGIADFCYLLLFILTQSLPAAGTGLKSFGLFFSYKKALPPELLHT